MEGAQEPGSSLGTISAGSWQLELMYGPVAHLMHLVNYGVNDRGCRWSQQIWQDALVLGSSQASSLTTVCSAEREGRWTVFVWPVSTQWIPLGPCGCMQGTPQVSDEENHRSSGTRLKWEAIWHLIFSSLHIYKQLPLCNGMFPLGSEEASWCWLNWLRQKKKKILIAWC